MKQSLGPWLPIEHTAKTLIRLVGWPGRLIWVIAGCTGYFIGFVALWRAAMFESVLLSKQVCAWWLFGKIFSGTERLMTLKVGMQRRVRVLEYYQICSNDDPGLTLTYFTARSNLVPYAFVWKNGKTIDVSETIVVYDIKVGRCCQLNEYTNLWNIKGQRSFIDLRWRSLRFNIFKLLFLWNR